MNAGAHDGSSILEAAFDGFTGMGRDPVVVVVNSARIASRFSRVAGG
jgi:hypothetical protein